MKPRRHRPVALLLLVLHLGACTSWRPIPVSPREYIETEEPANIRITTSDGETAVVPRPTIANDSIQGNICELMVAEAGEQVCTETSETRRYALADVTDWQVRREGSARTLGIVVGLAILAAILVTSGECLGDFTKC